MTRREWEDELRKNLKDLPKSEQDKVLEYYDEVYEDKREMGMTPIQIVKEFGNPSDVANKIKSEYDEDKIGGINLENVEISFKKPEPEPEPIAAEQPKKKYSESIQTFKTKFNKKDMNNYDPYKAKVKRKSALLTTLGVLLKIIAVTIGVVLYGAGIVYVIACSLGVAASVAAIVLTIISSAAGAELWVTIGLAFIIMAICFVLLSLSRIIFGTVKLIMGCVRKKVKKSRADIYARRAEL